MTTSNSKQVKSSGTRRPPAAGRGRKRGSTNKITKTIKDAIEVAFNQVGGADYLAKMAKEQPVAFMTLLGKVLPTQIDANVTATPAYTVDDWIVPPPEHAAS